LHKFRQSAPHISGLKTKIKSENILAI
jgi:hypothetical protein